ncbi:MAG: hypothetical protein AABX01_04865, partial [Candidatus Micrarchaeota archaeon]
ECSTPIVQKVETLCDVNSCSLHVKTFYDLNVAGTMVFNPASSCYDGVNPCKGNNQCRVRGSQDGENICALLEDSNDYDWNDVVFSTRVIDFPSGSKLLEVDLDQCVASNPNPLSVTFDFPQPKYVTDLRTREQKYDDNPSFPTWPNCRNFVGDTQRFFVSADPLEKPPGWNFIPFLDVAPINIDLWSYALDEDGASSLTYSLVSQINTSATTCQIVGNRFFKCSPWDWAQGANVRSIVTIRATDPQGLWTDDVNVISTGPTIDLPRSITIKAGKTLSLNFYQYVMSPNRLDVFLSGNVIYPGNPAIAKCSTTPPEVELYCQGYNPGTTYAKIEVNGGTSQRDVMEVVVVP